jgi:hypothetical protein
MHLAHSNLKHPDKQKKSDLYPEDGCRTILPNVGSHILYKLFSNPEDRNKKFKNYSTDMQAEVSLLS